VHAGKTTDSTKVVIASPRAIGPNTEDEKKNLEVTIGNSIHPLTTKHTNMRSLSYTYALYYILGLYSSYFLATLRGWEVE